MLPNKLAHSLSRLHETVTRVRVATVLAPLRPFSKEPRPDLPAVMQVFADLSVQQARFGKTERALLQAFGLQVLTDAAWWARLVTGMTRSALPEELGAELVSLCARLEMVATGFPALATLSLMPDEVFDQDADGVVLLVPGRDGEHPPLDQIAAALDAVSQLWSAAEDLAGQRGKLQLISIELGPPLALQFAGLGDPVGELRALLVSVLEQTQRLPDMPSEERSAIVLATLPVMERLGHSGRPDAQRVRSAIESGVTRLLEASGSVLPPKPSADNSSRNRPQLPPTAAAAGIQAEPALSQSVPDPDKGISEQDISHLAKVIAEERRQLQPAEPVRRMWQGTGAARPS